MRKTIVSFTMDEEELKLIDSAAAKMKMNRSATLRSILMFWDRHNTEVTLTPQAVNPGNDREITASGS